ncbi:MAG: AbrB/MazE/SpoVT family DNA-binding domain-containing protein [Chloroflexi bacterium]|nr:AbrB/MazE/SpoVT family DNA-binding domain-containing protein [Chloroflexota bacterium]
MTLPRSIRRAVGLKPGDVVTFRAVGPGTVEISVLSRLRLADLLERYPIEGPIDEAVDREQWEARAAQDVFGERHE